MGSPAAGKILSRITAIKSEGQPALACSVSGAVKRSKNLKAIVVDGNGKTEFADQGQTKCISYETCKLIAACPLTSQALKEFGTVVMMTLVINGSALATRNHRHKLFEGEDGL
jgi:aldehyde:ferredoxin oxidoreductase